MSAALGRGAIDVYSMVQDILKLPAQEVIDFRKSSPREQVNMAIILVVKEAMAKGFSASKKVQELREFQQQIACLEEAEAAIPVEALSLIEALLAGSMADEPAALASEEEPPVKKIKIT